MAIKQHIKAFVLLCMLILSHTYTYSEPNMIGQVTSTTGKVYIIRKGHIKPIQITQDSLPISLNAADKIMSKSNGIAHIIIRNNTKIILKSNSKIHFESSDQHTLDNGKVLYKIEKKDTFKGLNVATKSAVIGVKGTEFLIDILNNEERILLNTGAITVDSIKGEFKILKQKELSEFELYQKNYHSEYKEYKTKLNAEFESYVKSLTLTKGMGMKINSDNSVMDLEFSEQDIKDFNSFQEF